jgi:hypothetical protein
MELFRCPNECYIRVTDQYEPSPYSGLKKGDQIDLEVMIAQYEYENGERLTHQIRVAPGSPEVISSTYRRNVFIRIQSRPYYI